MIKKIFSITVASLILLVGATQVQHSYGLTCAGPTIEEEFSKSKWVFLGKFVSEVDAGIFSDNTILNFEVIENYKGKSSPMMKVLNSPTWRHSFSTQESVIFAGPNLYGQPELFLCTNSGKTSDQGISKVREISEILENNPNVPSPRTQIKSGIEPENVLCREDLVLIFKATDYSPVCVKHSTAQKLLERGWTKLGNP